MMNKKIFFLFVTLLALSLFAQIPPTYSDVDYVGDGDEKHLIDIYIPDGLTEPAPILMWIHGGAWFSGSKGGAYRKCDSLYHNGYILADINYRYSTDSIFPAQIYDCKAAIRYLKANADEYMIDTTKFAVGGSSAGGHLAALIGATNSVDSLENLDLGNAHVSSDVDAVCDFYGSSDFLRMMENVPITPPDSCDSYPNHLAPDSPISILLGCPVLDCPEKAISGNTIYHLDSSDPPFIIFHGTFDCTVSPFQSILLDSALTEFGIDHELYLIEHAGHGSMPEFDWPTQKHRMRVFLDRIFFDDEIEESKQAINNFEIIVYPNPFNSKITIDLPEQARKVEIYDVLGNLVKEKNTPKNRELLWQPDAQLQSGLYFIRVHFGIGRESIANILYLK